LNIDDLISSKVKSIPPSGIRKFFDLINEMKDAISLSIGEPDFDTPWCIREEGIFSLEKGKTHYSPNAGFMELREEIARFMHRKFGLDYRPSETIVTVGGSEAIDLVLRAVTVPGDEVIIPEPSFVAYSPCTVLAGGKPVAVPLKVENEFRLTRDDLAKAITDRTKAVFLPFPCNPTGAVMGYDDLKDIADLLRDKDILVISDEIYAELTYGSKHISIASFDGMKEKTLVINGFSKAYAMTGWRLGYACGPKPLIDIMIKIHQFAIMSAPTTAQFAGIEALKNCDKEIVKMNSEYQRRKRVIVDGLNEVGLDCFEPYGAFYCFPSVKRTGLTSEKFAEKLLMEEKVAVVPGNAFGASGEGFVRVCYAASMENIFEALKRINRFMGRMN
jgi:aminotransferase